MSPELIYLSIGLFTGANIMNAIHGYWGWRDAGRSAARARAAAEATLKRAAGDRYLSSLKLYQLQQREQARP